MNKDKPTLTRQQQKALHLLFTQVSKECMDKGIEMRHLVDKEIPIQATPENMKWLWKQLQDGLFKTKSTTELKKTGEIEIVYDEFNKLLIERTQGEISLPPFPSSEATMEALEEEMTIRDTRIENYPEEDIDISNTKF